MIKINDWIRYEVNSKGQPAKDGDDLRAGSLDYIRLKNHGHAINRGMHKLQRVAKGRTAEVFGIFCLFLELAGNGSKESRGVLREEKNGRPATIKELAEILPATAKQIEFAVKCLSNPAVSWILADKEGFPENSGDSRKSADASRIQHNTTQLNTTQHNAPKKERYIERYKIFYSKYPKKVKPDKVKEWFIKNEPTEQQLQQMLWMIEKQSAKDERLYWGDKARRQFVPHPTTWLNDGDWRQAPTTEEVEAVEKAESKAESKAEAERLEKRRQEVRDELGGFFREKTTEKLEAMLIQKNKKYFMQYWLIREILQEREGRKCGV